MLRICKESRKVAAKCYKRCYEKAQRSPELGARRWSGNLNDLREEKLKSILSDGNELFVNFSADIFIVSRHPDIPHEQKNVGLADYNFKPFQIHLVQRVQQVYSERRALMFPEAIFSNTWIREYTLVMDGPTKRIRESRGPIVADITRRKFRTFLQSRLWVFLSGKELNVPLVKWEVELR